MAVKSVIDVEVNSAEFTRFQELFTRYEEQLAKTPSAWAKVSKENMAVSKNFERMAAALMAQNAAARETAEANKKQDKHVTNSAKMWTSVEKSTKNIASNLISATRSLISWTGILGGIGGLLGAGGLFGLDKMAGNVANQRRSSMGLGLSTGEQRAFQVNFGRLVDPDAYLGWVNQMETDPTKAWSSYALGAGGPTGNTEKDAVGMLKALRSKAQATPLSQLGMLQGQFGLSGVSTEDLRRLKSMSGDEFNSLLSGNSRDSKGLNLTDPIAKKWQDFSTQLERAGSEIFKTFVVGLSPLVKPLEHLSGAAAKFLETLLKSDLLAQGIKNLSHWLETFSGKLGSQKWLDTVTRFTSDVGALADIIHNIAHPVEAIDKVMRSDGSVMDAVASRALFNASPSQQMYMNRLSELEKVYKLPAGILSYQAQMESGMDLTGKFNKPNGKGAVGTMQLTPIALKEIYEKANFKIDPTDPLQSAIGAAVYDSINRDRFGNDPKKILAAYNMGPSALSGAIASKGANWQQGLNSQTAGYIANAPGVTITIMNPAGADVQVSAGQLAH